MAASWMSTSPRPVPLRSITLIPDPKAPIYKGINQSIATTQIQQNVHWVSKKKSREIFRVSLVKGFRGIWARDFTIGTSPTCDLVLPELPYVDDLHCILRLDRPWRLILQDVSKYGTQVTYNGEGRHPFPRKGGRWIVGGDPNLENFKITIEITNYLRFRLETNYGLVARDDLSLIARTHGMADVSEFFYDGTFTATLPQPDRSMGILLRVEDIGSGESSKVTKGWDVSTGAMYAIKEPAREPKDDPNFDREKWRREINTMSTIWKTRAHGQQGMREWRRVIIQLIWASSPEHPILIYEYSPFGTVKDQHAKRRMSLPETERIFSQCLQAVEFLDEVVDLQHGDIRPEHILVMRRPFSRYDDDIQVKLIGFGEAGNPTRYFRGELEWDVYRWPSAWSSNKEFTRATADIWSAAMVALEMVNPSLLPQSERDCAALKRRVLRASFDSNQSTQEVLAILLRWIPGG